MVTIGKALEWMMHGYPIRMDAWEDNEYLRYSELLGVFELHMHGDDVLMEVLELNAGTFCEACWVLGKWHPMGHAPIWEVKNDRA
jgi:hypothetical protein